MLSVQMAFGASFVIGERPKNLPALGDAELLATKIINFFLGFVGLIAVLMLLLGGVRYLTSGGDDQAVQKAKSTILYAIIGIVIVVLSYAVVFTITNALLDPGL